MDVGNIREKEQGNGKDDRRNVRNSRTPAKVLMFGRTGTTTPAATPAIASMPATSSTKTAASTETTVGHQSPQQQGCQF
jgi:hypothetical protein